ncbi:efflux RND transporter periplasmic adaptor subunit [Candidatus Symbiobacter mobilis]|nr:efflux RND transporter periplasmic adaptor subunit [Candidatus Symbiobacter mobilis]
MKESLGMQEQGGFAHGNVPIRAVVTAALACCAACWGSLSWAAPEVAVVAVQSRAVGQLGEFDAVVQAVQQSTLSAQTSGRILGLRVQAGDRVRAGQLLATIDDRETQAGVSRATAAVAQARAELHNAKAHFARNRELRAQGFVSASALDTAQAQLDATQAAMEQAEAMARQSSVQQGFTQLTAPYDALVLQTHAEAGDLAVPGKSIVTVFAPQALRVVVQLPLSRAKAISAASAVEIEMPQPDGSTQWITPAVRTLLPGADPVAQTVEYRLDLPKSIQGVLPGQQVRVRIASGLQQRMVIPRSAVLQRGELTAVYVDSAQGFVLRAVRLGGDYAQGVEVLAGLTNKDRVALDPLRAGLAGASSVGR